MPGPVLLKSKTNMSGPQEAKPAGRGPEKSTFTKLKDHAKEFMDATPEEHKK